MNVYRKKKITNTFYCNFHIEIKRKTSFSHQFVQNNTLKVACVNQTTASVEIQKPEISVTKHEDKTNRKVLTLHYELTENVIGKTVAYLGGHPLFQHNMQYK